MNSLVLPGESAYSLRMASTNIMVNDLAYAALKKLKQPGESFSKVILRHLRPPADTAGELLERIEHAPPPPVNLDRLAQFESGRKRRSTR